MCSPFIVWLCLLTRATKRFDRVGFFFHFWAAAHLQTCQLEITIIVIISNSRKKGGGASKIHLWDLIQFPQLPALLGKFSKILHKNVPFLLLQIRSRYRIFFVYYPCQERRHLKASHTNPNNISKRLRILASWSLSSRRNVWSFSASEWVKESKVSDWSSLKSRTRTGQP